jgi:hypothetical protein
MEMKMNTSTMQCSQASSFYRRTTLVYQRLIIDNRLDAALQSFFFAADLVAPFCESLREDDIIAEAQSLGNEFSPGEKATFFLVGESWGKCSEPSKVGMQVKRGGQRGGGRRALRGAARGNLYGDENWAWGQETMTTSDNHPFNSVA